MRYKGLWWLPSETEYRARDLNLIDVDRGEAEIQRMASTTRSFFLIAGADHLALRLGCRLPPHRRRLGGSQQLG